MKLLVRKNIFKGHVASLCYDEVWHNYDNSVKTILAEKRQRSYVSILLNKKFASFYLYAMSILCDPHYL